MCLSMRGAGVCCHDDGAAEQAAAGEEEGTVSDPLEGTMDWDVEEETPYCPVCGNTTGLTATECKACGAELGPPAEAPAASIFDDGSYCDGCRIITWNADLVKDEATGFRYCPQCHEARAQQADVAAREADRVAREERHWHDD